MSLRYDLCVLYITASIYNTHYVLMVDMLTFDRHCANTPGHWHTYSTQGTAIVNVVCNEIRLL